MVSAVAFSMMVERAQVAHQDRVVEQLARATLINVVLALLLR
jgi:hypothetical protein